MREVLLIRGWWLLANTMVTLSQHHGDLDGHGVIMGVMHGGGGTPLSVIRPCGMDITPRKALDMYGSLHLTIRYLLRSESHLK